MPLSQLFHRAPTAPAAPPAPPAPLRPEDLRIVQTAHPAPGLVVLHLVAPDGTSLLTWQVVAPLLTPMVLAQFAEMRFLLELDRLTPPPSLTVVRGAAPAGTSSGLPSGELPAAALAAAGAAAGAAAAEPLGLLSHVAPL